MHQNALFRGRMRERGGSKEQSKVSDVFHGHTFAEIDTLFRDLSEEVMQTGKVVRFDNGILGIFAPDASGAFFWDISGPWKTLGMYHRSVRAFVPVRGHNDPRSDQEVIADLEVAIEQLVENSFVEKFGEYETSIKGSP